MTPLEKAIEVLEVTASNLRSIGPAGAVEPYVTYRPWLAHVEEVLAELNSEWICPKCGIRRSRDCGPSPF